MKKTNSLLGLILSALLILGVTSCDTAANSSGDSPANTPAESPVQETKFLISYSTNYGKSPSDKEVNNGYKLTSADLPSLTAEGFVFGGWTCNNQVVSVGFEVTKKITLTAFWTPASEYEPNHGINPENPHTQPGTEDNPNGQGDSGVIDPGHLNPDPNENPNTVKGKSGYCTLRFDVSDVNKEYGLSLEAPADIEVYAGDDAKDGDYAFLVLNKSDKYLWFTLPEITDQTINGVKYKVLWTYDYYDGTVKTLRDSKKAKNSQSDLSMGVGEIKTIKATLKRYAKVTITSSRGNAPEPFELYETEEIAWKDMPRPTAALRRVGNYKLNDEPIFKDSNDVYVGTGKDVTLDVLFVNLQIGDLILVDGTVISGLAYDKESDPAPLAMVFYLGDQEDSIHSSDILAVGLQKGEYKAWCSSMVDSDGKVLTPSAYYTELGKWNTINDSISYSIPDYDGVDNYKIIKEADPDGIYPAFEYAVNYGKEHGATTDVLKTGWYLPTLNIYGALVSALRPCNKILKNAGANFCQLNDGTLIVNTYDCWTSNTNSNRPVGCWIQPTLDTADGIGDVCSTSLVTWDAKDTDLPSLQVDGKTSTSDGGINSFAVIKLAK